LLPPLAPGTDVNMGKRAQALAKAKTRLNNIALLAIIAMLCVGIFADGVLYNRPPTQTNIHALKAATNIEIQHKGEQVYQFVKTGKQWQQTHPFSAPASSDRIDMLLSTNNFANRNYPASSLPLNEIFEESITLKIDNIEFLIGTMEPVSQLRYVRSEDQVYLQPDIIVPLLGAAKNPFIDLALTSKVDKVKISDNWIDAPDAWSHLRATRTVAKPGAKENQRETIDIHQSKGKMLRLVATLSDAGYVLSHHNGFHYLLDNITSEKLDLANLISSEQ